MIFFSFNVSFVFVVDVLCMFLFFVCFDHFSRCGCGEGDSVINVHPTGLCGIVFISFRNVTSWKDKGLNPISHVGLFNHAGLPPIDGSAVNLQLSFTHFTFPCSCCTLECHHSHATGVMKSVLLWPATVLLKHEWQCSSDSRSAMQMNLDPQPHTYHPGLFPSPKRSAWLKYPWRCIFYIELCMEV